MSVDSELSTPERIRTIQRQLRIAVQNHQVLYMRKKRCPNDLEIQNHMNVIQGLIISMGRTQAELLAQYRQEVEQMKTANEEIEKTLAQNLTFAEVPKGIPIYSKQLNGSSPVKEEKKRRFFGQGKKFKSVIKGESISLIGRSQMNLLRTYARPKRLTSVHKSQKLLAARNDLSTKTQEEIQISSDSSGSDNKEKSSSSPEEIDFVDIRSPRRSSRKKAMRDSKEEWPLVDLKDEVVERPLSLDDVTQEKFLGFFGLISQSKSAFMKSKRCERKRRSVAGQSSFYSDYLQPVPQAKRNHASKKTAVAPAVIVEAAIEIEDEDEKNVKIDKQCVVCNNCDDNGAENLSNCALCLNLFHPSCVPGSTSSCPSCSSQSLKVQNIVGARSAGSASSSDIIMRYLTMSSNGEDEDKNN